MGFNFVSDNVTGASAPVLDALLRPNAGPQAAYGADALTRAVQARIAEIFEHEVAVFLVATGTAANALSVATLVDPWGSCLCHAEAHLVEGECGAPEFFAGGSRLVGVPGIGGRISADDLDATIRSLSPAEKQMPAQALSLSQATEAGCIYRPDEIAALTAVARAHRLGTHMDGARFANALVASGASPADLTWRAGIDILSFGGTKNGCLAAEAVVMFDPARAGAFHYRRKRAGHTLSKGRLLAAQYLGYLAHDHWLDNARHANAMAARLAGGLAARGIGLAWPAEVNEVFAFLPPAIDDALRQGGAAYHGWTSGAIDPARAGAPGTRLSRLITSFATTEAEVDGFLALIDAAAPSAAATPQSA